MRGDPLVSVDSQCFPGTVSIPSQDCGGRPVRAKVDPEINEMRAVIYAQFNPVKTMEQLIGDRCVLRIGILAGVIIAACF
jgi:hypothetical protein